MRSEPPRSELRCKRPVCRFTINKCLVFDLINILFWFYIRFGLRALQIAGRLNLAGIQLPVMHRRSAPRFDDCQCTLKFCARFTNIQHLQKMLAFRVALCDC